MSKVSYADILSLPFSAYEYREMDIDPSYTHLYSQGSVLADKKVLVGDKSVPFATYNGYILDPDDEVLDATAKHEYLLERAHELNKNLPPNSKEYWIVKEGRLDKVPVKQMIEICNIGRNMSSFGV